MKFANAVVKSSIVAFALRRLLGESGVAGLDDIVVDELDVPAALHWMARTKKYYPRNVQRGVSCMQTERLRTRNEMKATRPDASSSWNPRSLTSSSGSKHLQSSRVSRNMHNIRADNSCSLHLKINKVQTSNVVR